MVSREPLSFWTFVDFQVSRETAGAAEPGGGAPGARAEPGPGGEFDGRAVGEGGGKRGGGLALQAQRRAQGSLSKQVRRGRLRG